MKNVIIYSSKYGCTKKCAEYLAGKLSQETQIFDLKQSEHPDLNKFDTVIIGTPIYMGRIPKEVKKFLTSNLEILDKLRISLFVCSLSDKNKTMEALKLDVPALILEKAYAIDLFGAEIEYKKLKLFDKLVVNLVSKMAKKKYPEGKACDFSHKVTTLDNNLIDEFADKIVRN